MKKISWLFIGLSLLIISLPVFLAKSGYLLLGLKSAGEFGDVIGGVTAPFVGLLGAYLVFVAFQAQNKANEIQAQAIKEQSRDREIDIFLRLSADIEEHFEKTIKLSRIVKQDVQEFTYWSSMKTWLDINLMSKWTLLDKIYVLTRQLDYLVDYALFSKLISEEDKDLLLHKVYLSLVMELKRNVIEIDNLEAHHAPNRKLDLHLEKDIEELLKRVTQIVYPMCEKVEKFLKIDRPA